MSVEHKPILMELMRRPQDLRTTPMLLAVTPFPSPLTTPPVTSTYFIFTETPQSHSLLHKRSHNYNRTTNYLPILAHRTLQDRLGPEEDNEMTNRTYTGRRNPLQDLSGGLLYLPPLYVWTRKSALALRRRSRWRNRIERSEGFYRLNPTFPTAWPHFPPNS